MILREITIEEYSGTSVCNIYHYCDDDENKECDGYGIHYDKHERHWELGYDYETYVIKVCPYCGKRLELKKDTIVIERIRKYIRYPYKAVQQKRKYEKELKERKKETYKGWLESREQLHRALNSPIVMSGTYMGTGMWGMPIDDMRDCIDILSKDIEEGRGILETDSLVDISHKECNCDSNLTEDEKAHMCGHGKCGKRGLTYTKYVTT